MILLKYTLLLAFFFVLLVMVAGPYIYHWLNPEPAPFRWHPLWVYRFRRWRIRARRRWLARFYKQAGLPPLGATMLFLALITLYVIGTAIF